MVCVTGVTCPGFRCFLRIRVTEEAEDTQVERMEKEKESEKKVARGR